MGHERKATLTRELAPAFPMVFVVLVIWLVGAAVTRYSLEQMAYFAPIAVVVVGATSALVLLWVKIMRES